MKKLVLTILTVFVGLPMLAQEAIPATGGDVTESEGSVSYTIGQVLYITNTGTNGSVAEGVQQPYEISVVVGIEHAKDINLICKAYPNPSTDLLILEVESAANEDLYFQLYDMMGKLLVSKKLLNIKTNISMANLAPSTYFLKVTDHQKVVKTFKIIKTQ
jgi:hypothetical protein